MPVGVADEGSGIQCGGGQGSTPARRGTGRPAKKGT